MVKLWHLCVSPPYPKDHEEDFTALQPVSKMICLVYVLELTYV